jgi:hypothetical protein
MILVCSPHHPLAASAVSGGRPIDGLRIIGFDRGLPIRRNIDRQLAEFGIEVETSIAFDNVDTIKRAIVVNAGRVFCRPRAYRASCGGRVGFGLHRKVSLTRPLGIIHRRGVEPGQTAQRFIELLTGAAYAPNGSAGDAFRASALETGRQRAQKDREGHGVTVRNAWRRGGR